MINQGFKALGREYQVCLILQEAKGAQSYEFSRMRAQFLLFHLRSTQPRSQGVLTSYADHEAE